jgi:hypothetical protein
VRRDEWELGRRRAAGVGSIAERHFIQSDAPVWRVEAAGAMRPKCLGGDRMGKTERLEARMPDWRWRELVPTWPRVTAAGRLFFAGRRKTGKGILPCRHLPVDFDSDLQVWRSVWGT